MANHNVIIGGGPAATNAIETIRQYEADAQITLISDEPAHSRMALPYWLSGQFSKEHANTADDAHWQKLNVDTRIGGRVQTIDPDNNAVTLDDGSTLNYDNLLIATGAAPLGLPVPGNNLPGVQTLWSIADTQKVLDATAGLQKPRVVLVGAGFIGLIVLNAMHKRGWNLTVVEREPQVLPRMLDADAGKMAESWLRQEGVDVHTGDSLAEITAGPGDAKTVKLENGTTIDADVVILSTGIKPNIDIVAGTSIRTDQGIVVNDQMQTTCANIYASGDVAQGPVLGGGEPAIHAIQPTAVDHGRIAGANMAGQEIHYPGSLLMNVLDVCGLQCASFGNWSDSNAEATTICNNDGFVYRKLLWTGDRITGAIFAGRANDMGMLPDVGMVKGFLQTQTSLGVWKQFVVDNPFDIRRPYVACRVAEKLVGTTLLGKPAQARKYHAGGVETKTEIGSSHEVFVGTK